MFSLKSLFFSAILFFSCTSIFAQSTYIGDTYENIKQGLSYIDKGNVKSFVKTEYKDGEISNIYLYLYKQKNTMCGYVTSYFTNYRIKNNICVSIDETYSDMSAKELKGYYDKCYEKTKIGEYYFSPDYKTYRLVSEDAIGNAIVDLKETNISELPANIKTQYEIRNKKAEEARGKIYNLKDINKVEYDNFIKKLNSNFINGLTNLSDFPSWGEIKEMPNGVYVYNNIYSADYKRVKTASGFKNDNKFTLVSGKNKSCSLIKQFSPKLYSENLNGQDVMTEIIISNYPVVYTKGVTNVSIKKGVITFTKNEPKSEIKEQLKKELSDVTKGKFEIFYQYLEVNGKVSLVFGKQKQKGNNLLNKAKGFSGF